MGNESTLAAEAAIAKRLIHYTSDLERLGADTSRRVLAILKRLQASLVTLLVERHGSIGEILSGRSPNRWKALLKQVQELIDSSYGEIASTTHGTFVRIAEIEPAAVAAIVTKGIQETINVQIELDVKVLTPEMLTAAADANIEGAPASEWWGRQSRGAYEKFVDTMRQGFVQGTPLDELVTDVRGTAAAGYSDGILSASMRDATTLVRTSLLSVANDARTRLYSDNQDVIKGVQALVTLDRRTSEICRPRATCAWDMDGKPFPDSPCQFPFPGPPPWHMRCRTTLTPALRPWKEILGYDVEEFKSTRSARNQAGKSIQVPQDWTYQDWLETQTAETQKDILGRGKYELWRKGKISVTDLMDASGNPLSLKQVEERIKSGLY